MCLKCVELGLMSGQSGFIGLAAGLQDILREDFQCVVLESLSWNSKIPFVVVVASAATGKTTELFVPEMVMVDPDKDKVCVSVVTVEPGAHWVPSYFNT